MCNDSAYILFRDFYFEILHLYLFLFSVYLSLISQIRASWSKYSTPYIGSSTHTHILPDCLFSSCWQLSSQLNQNSWYWFLFALLPYLSTVIGLKRIWIWIWISWFWIVSLLSSLNSVYCGRVCFCNLLCVPLCMSLPHLRWSTLTPQGATIMCASIKLSLSPLHAVLFIACF